MMTLPKNEFRISITSACNMKCIYCHNEGNKAICSLTKKEIEELIKSAKGLGLEKVRITGGEPLIHPEIEEICKMLKTEYNLKVGINSNIIEIEKLLKMIESGYIDRVVVGLDYIDGKISKQSPIGKSSKEILEGILEIKKRNCNVTISTVYNGNYNNTYKILKWGIENGIRVKILEEVKNEIAETSTKSYIDVRDKLIKDFNLETDKDIYNQVQGYKNGINVVSFFHSHCRLRECDLCKKMHLRITSKGTLKQCLHYQLNDVKYQDGDILENIKTVLNTPVDFHRNETGGIVNE